MDSNQLQELKETLQELIDSDGTLTQQETAQYILNCIDIMGGKNGKH